MSGLWALDTSPSPTQDDQAAAWLSPAFSKLDPESSSVWEGKEGGACIPILGREEALGLPMWGEEQTPLARECQGLYSCVLSPRCPRFRLRHWPPAITAHVDPEDLRVSGHGGWSWWVGGWVGRGAAGVDIPSGMC